MAQLSPLETSLLENLFEMGSGYVLNFSDQTFGQFVRDSTNIDVYDLSSDFFGLSKAKRLRKLWMIADDEVVGILVDDLINAISDKYTAVERSTVADSELIERCQKIATRLKGKQAEIEPIVDALTFEYQEIDEVNLSILGFDIQLTEILSERVLEVKKCLNVGAPLSAVFMCGSILEGILLSIAQTKPREFNQAKASPKEPSSGAARQFHEWTLLNFIDVASELSILGLDVKKHSHSLRDFRNYIHPAEQKQSGFTPDMHTAKISWQVLKAAFQDILAAKQDGLI